MDFRFFTKEKTNLVQNIFTDVASKYDLMNDLMSFSLHRKWKKIMVSKIILDDARNKILDIASGTGDIIKLIYRKNKANKDLRIFSTDLNKNMLEISRRDFINKNYSIFPYFSVSNGEVLPYKDEVFDYCTISFGIRNFSDIEKGIREVYRVLRKGGKFVCLEFSQVNNLILSKIYDLYSSLIIPKLGKMIASNEEGYQYLIESIKRFPNQNHFTSLVREYGFSDVKYESLNKGVVTIYEAIK